MARWTTDWDCGHETNWWYVIKDEPFDIKELKAKRRYEINKGLKNFEIIKITEPEKYAQGIYEIVTDAYQDYPRAYRPQIEKESFIKGVKNWNRYELYGAISKETGSLVAYARLFLHEGYSDFEQMKAIRSYEKRGVNAALVYGILDDYSCRLNHGFYICDGTRSTNHETAFQDYLEKYFLFRKAYCHLHVEYNPKIRWAIPILYNFRKVLLSFDKNKLTHAINVVLKMEEICRSGAPDE